MKTLKTLLSIAILMAISISCNKDDLPEIDESRLTFNKPVDPTTQPSLLNQQFQIAGENLIGEMPNSTNGNLSITIAQRTASISADNSLFVPFVFRSDNEVKRMYVTVEGADNYWDIPINTEGYEGYVLNIGVPDNVLNGKFDLQYAIENESGEVSNTQTMDVDVKEAVSGCSFPIVDGSDGVHAQRYILGDTPGQLTVSFITYTVPDRVDIRYAGEWYSLTNGSPLNGGTPPTKKCNEVTPGDGFLGTSGNYTLPYDPSVSRELDVYVSGCLEGGTQWAYRVYCPESEPGEEPFYSQLPDCPCNYADVPKTTQDPKGKWKKTSSYNIFWKLYHPGAKYEARWVPEDGSKAGQQCTYDKNKNLITGGLGAGTPDIVSPGISISEHGDVDVDPFDKIACAEYLSKWQPNTGGCAANPVYDFSHMTSLVGQMTCHQVRIFLDGALNDNSIPEDLKDYIRNEGGNLGNTPVLQLLKDWKENKNNNNSCYIPVSRKEGVYELGPLCPLIDKAIQNMGG